MAVCAATLHGGQRQRPVDPSLPPLALDGLPAAVRDAVAAVYRAAQERPQEALASAQLGMLLHAYEQYALAAAYYEHAARLAPDTFAWPYLAGVVQTELGDNGRAIVSFRQAMRVNPGYVPARLRLADALLADGAVAESGHEYEDLIRTFPEFALAHYGLARLLTSLGDVDGAITHYQQAVDFAPQFGSAHYALALAFRDKGVLDRAARHMAAYQQFGAQRPSLADPLMADVRSLVGTARELIAQGARLGSAGRIDEAIVLHQKALAADSTAAQAHINLISLYGRARQTEKAEQHYREAVRLGSHVADAHYNFGVLTASLGRDTEAADAFRQALDADPFHVRAHNNLGALLARQGNRDAAMQHYRQALASDPQHQPSRLGLGRLLTEAGRPLEAVDHLQRLLRLPESADTPRYALALATAWYSAGETAKAIAHAEQALRDATRLRQPELAAAIARELERMKAGRR